MTSPTHGALVLLVDELGADAAVLVRQHGPMSAVVSASTIGAVREGDPWPLPPPNSSESMLDTLVTDPTRFASLVTTALRLGLPTPVRAVLTSPLTGGQLRLTVVWAQSEPPGRPAEVTATAAWGVFTTLAPLLDTQRSAEQSTARFRAVLGSMSQAVVLFDSSGGPGEVNAAAARLLGLGEGLVPADQLADAMRALRARAIEWEGTDREPEHALESSDAEVRNWVWVFDGQPSHLRVSITPIPGLAAGSRIWVFDDISRERELLVAEQQARAEAAASGQRFRMLVENAADVVFQSVDGVLAWISPNVESVTGWRPDDLIGGTTTHLWHPDDMDAAIRLRQSVYEGAEGQSVLRFRTAEGSYLWVEIALRPYDESSGRHGAVGLMRNVSARVEAEEAARRSEERYRFVAENATDVVARYSPDGIIEWVFGSTQDLLGVRAEELVGTRTTDWIHEADLSDFEEGVAALLRGEVIRGTVRLRRADGGTRWIDRRTRAVFDEAGEPAFIVSAWRDAQAEVEYREALAQSEREAVELAERYEVARNAALEASQAKTAFLSRMSHELRTPLNAVVGFAQLLALDPLTEEQLDALEQIQTGGRHLVELMNEILDISRIEAGRISLSLESVAVDDAVSEALDLIRPLAAAAGITLHWTSDEGASAHAIADRQRLIQVLINLLSNAVKYNRAGGSITIETTSTPPGEVRIAVTDTGRGIAGEDLPRLFEPFDRLGAESTDIEGTGIGLTLVDGLIRAMAGHIEVSSTPGVGSCFTVSLPAGQEVGEPITQQQDASEMGASSTTRVLYIEDNPANVTLMRRIAERRPGVTLVVATTGAEGLSAALRGAPDLVLLDLHLPDGSGIDVLTSLRADPRTCDLPIVVLTADASPDAQRRATAAGATGFVTKPFDVATVLAWIDHPDKEEKTP